MSEKLYTIGEITRLKLLKGKRGHGLTRKSAVSAIVRTLNPVEVPNRHGMSKCLTMDAVERYNATLALPSTKASKL